jgi:Ni/Fe-hydrogenase subunit HybB-like protein/Fe-S-cluster-containing dehydrogenase component
MSITRRAALRAVAAAGATALTPKHLLAREARLPAPGAVAVLYDPTRCIGCRECILGCSEANGCDAELATADDAVLATLALTVLERHEIEGEETFRKVQCMHCVDPACVSACMLGAMQRRADGSVTWNGDLCVGCRYCQIACPFNVPRFEWDTPAPRLRKCDLCFERRQGGGLPACVERCHRDALTFGAREEQLAEAHRRIEARPDLYNPRVYGEHEGGGTSFLTLAKAGVSFADMGLPELGDESVPSLPETIQHTIYRGFVAPLAVLGVVGAVVRRNAGKLRAEEAAAHQHERCEPVGGRLLTWPFAILLALALTGLGTVIWRFAAGLGATTNLNDGYPMGLWIAFDVVTGTALACGGYAVALLVYLANRGRYHPLVRAAVVTSALGYTLGGLSVLIDIGRAWNFYKIPLFFRDWNFNSILLEVALCIMCYTGVLWIEVSPILLERWRDSRWAGLRRVAVAASPRIERAMPYVIALGLLLPTMHQSSLGSLMLLAGPKLHALWHTPLLPLLFLVSCVGMGYAAVTLEATLSARVFKRPSETPMLRALSGPVALVLLTYAALRMFDVTSRGQLAAALSLDRHSVLFLIEMALFVVPALGLLARRRSAGALYLSLLAVLVIVGGALYRFSTYLIAFDPGPRWSYFPSVPEFAVTIGLVSAEILGYLFLVKRFPVLRGMSAAAPPGDGPGTTEPTPRNRPPTRPPAEGPTEPAMVGRPPPEPWASEPWSPTPDPGETWRQAPGEAEPDEVEPVGVPADVGASPPETRHAPQTTGDAPTPSRLEALHASVDA